MTDPSGDSSGMDEGSCGCGSEVEFGDHRLTSNQLAVRAAAFRLLLEHGEPVGFAAVAAESGVDVSTAIDVLRRFEARGNARLNSDTVVGIAGLSVEPTQHRIDVEVGRRWTWCAIDAVGIVGALGVGVILSETNDGPIELHVREGNTVPADLAIFVANGYGMTSSVVSSGQLLPHLQRGHQVDGKIGSAGQGPDRGFYRAPGDRTMGDDPQPSTRRGLVMGRLASAGHCVAGS